MSPSWTQAEPFDAVVLCLAAGLAVLILAAVVLDSIRHMRLMRELDSAQHEADPDEVEGLCRW